MHKLGALALFMILIFCAEGAFCELHTRDEVRAMYAELTLDPGTSPYAQEPSASGEYSAGQLTDAALSGALDYVNFLRKLAYLEGNVALDSLYTLRAQHAAVLLAANDALSHDAPRPGGMTDSFYQTAHTGTMSSNIAAINWMADDILCIAVEYFVRDDGAANLETLGHRRWLLNPYLGATGFGLANSETGMSYAAMYAHDASADPGQWESVRWPSEGAFPADLTSADIPWSVILNPEVYADDFSETSVQLYEKTAGRAGLRYFGVSTDNYGAGPCIIFMPDLEEMGISDYQQNQVWHVRIDGLRTLDGKSASIEYMVEMMSLYPIDPVSVEVEPRALEMDVGDLCILTAQVVPEWADDVSVSWSSTDENVATVDEEGYVTAVAPGKCEIVATSVNGRSDACNVNVK